MSSSPVNVSSSSSVSTTDTVVTGLSPVEVGSVNVVHTNVIDFDVYSGENGLIHIPFEFSGIMSPIFPPPTQPVALEPLPNPDTAPVLAKSNTASGHLLPGKYRYCYAAWRGDKLQATAPSPVAEITLTTENTTTLAYPSIPGADGYHVYREQELHVYTPPPPDEEPPPSDEPVDEPGDPIVTGNWVDRPDLPFDVPVTSIMRSSTKKYWAHYFFTFPVAFTSNQDSPTAPDVDTRLYADGSPYSTANQWHRWNPPSYGSYAAYGGEVRDRPEFMRPKRPKVESPTKPGKMLDFRVQDKITEIRQAQAAGIDGFTPDWLDVPKTAKEYDLSIKSSDGGAPHRWRQIIELYEACAEVNRQDGPGSFYLVPMPDGTTQATLNATNLAKAILYLQKNYPGVHYFRNGKLVLSPYYPEKAPDKTGTGTVPLNFWKSVISTIKSGGYSTYFLPCYQNTWTAAAQQPMFRGITSGISQWGDRSPAQCRGENSRNRLMHQVIKRDYPGNEFMCPVAFQDFRPNQKNYFESDHAETLHESWKTAIGVPGSTKYIPAQMVQVPTWNDYAEGAYIAPTYAHGWVFLDLSLWYAIRWKTGSYPKINKDAIYLTHRVQPTDSDTSTTMNYTGPQTAFMKKRSDGMTDQNTVSVVCFFKAADNTVIFDIGGRTVTRTGIGSGRQVVKVPLLPIGTGLVSVKAIRNGSEIARVSSAERRRVKTTRVAQDLGYYGAKSLPNAKVKTSV